MQNNSIPTVNGADAGSKTAAAPTKTAEIAVILDRSGSMEAIATDAIGRTIKKMTESFAARPVATRPDTIIVAILTDGEENASRTFSQPHIADLIAEKRAQGWEFIFLAANQDAIASASRLSIPAADADSFNLDPAGARVLFSKLSHRVMEKRVR